MTAALVAVQKEGWVMESLSQDFAEMRREMELLSDANKRIVEAAQKAVREIAERDAALAAKDAELARMRGLLAELFADFGKVHSIDWTDRVAAALTQGEQA